MSKDTQGNATPKFLTVQESVDGVLDFTLANGKSVQARYDDLSPAMQRKCGIHGLNQKMRDGTASLSKGQQYAEAYAELVDIYASLKAGEWFRRGSGNGGQVVQDLIAAIAKLKKATPEAVAAAYAKASEEQRKEWAKNPAVAKVMADLKTARLAAAAKDAPELDINLG